MSATLARTVAIFSSPKKITEYRDTVRLIEPRHEKWDTNDNFFLKNWDFDVTWLVSWWEAFSKIIRVVSFFVAELCHFLFHADHTLHIDMPNVGWPPRKTVRMSLVSLFSWRGSISNSRLSPSCQLLYYFISDLEVTLPMSHLISNIRQQVNIGRYRRVSHNAVTMETSGIECLPGLIPFWFLSTWRNPVNSQCRSVWNCSEINYYQNVIKHCGHPIALVSIVTTLC